MITVKGLCKSFDQRMVLEDITVSFPEGKVSVVLGPSGHGKTVLLKCLAGLLRPDAGEVHFNGYDLLRLPENEMVEFWHKVGFVFQENALLDSLTVEDNLALYWRIHPRIGEEQIRRKISEFLELVGLSDCAGRLPDELSGGMKKRIAIIRALIKEPDYLLIDEPTGGVDRSTSVLIRKLLVQSLNQKERTLVVVTHDIQLTREIADQVIGLRNGRILFSSPKEQMTEEQLNRLYKGAEHEAQEC